MTGQHVNQCKLIFSEYGWPEALISDKVHAIPCKPSPVLCSLTMSIMLQVLCLPTVQWSYREYVQIVKACCIKPKREGKDFCKCLIDIIQYPTHRYYGNHLCRFSKAGIARSDLPMYNAARKQLGIQPEVVRNNDKHAVLPTYDLLVGQDVMYQDSTIKHWYPSCNPQACVLNQEATRSLQEMVLFTEIPNLIRSLFTPQKREFSIF